MRKAWMAMVSAGVLGCAGADYLPPTEPLPPASPVADEEVVLSIIISDSGFIETEAPIEVGTVVRWMNAGTVPHRIYMLNALGSSPPIEPDQSWEMTFEGWGIYKYTCALHPRKKGRVVVSAL